MDSGISHMTVKVNESQGLQNWYKNVELGGLWYHAMYERNQSVNVLKQADVHFFW